MKEIDMFNKTDQDLKDLGADITTREIKQQPALWEEVIQDFKTNGEYYANFLSTIKDRHDHTRVIFTGAGTSAFVGESIKEYLNKVEGEGKLSFEAIATTDLVATPEYYLKEDVPTILVSFARSGNSPESVAAVNVADKIVKDLYHITITCSKEGKLAQAAEKSDDNLLILQPELSNDQGFAMTGSYTCMALSALFLFDPTDLSQKIDWARQIVKLGGQVIDREDEIADLVSGDFNRVVYLGGANFFGLAKESQLKILELTAGQIATQYETPLGFRHGPKSFVNEETIVILFATNDAYTRQYEEDIMNEVYHDKIAQEVVSVSTQKLDHDAKQFVLDSDLEVPDAYLVLPYVILGQTVSLHTAVKVGNKPDTPSPTGTVNRVVQGVVIYDYDK